MWRNSDRILVLLTGVAAVLVGLTSLTRLALTQHDMPAPLRPTTTAMQLQELPSGQTQAAFAPQKNDSHMTTVEPLPFSAASGVKSDMDIVPAIDALERPPSTQVLAKAPAAYPSEPQHKKVVAEEASSMLLDIDADIMAAASMPTAKLSPLSDASAHSKINDIVTDHAVQARDAMAREIGGGLKNTMGGVLN